MPTSTQNQQIYLKIHTQKQPMRSTKPLQIPLVQKHLSKQILLTCQVSEAPIKNDRPNQKINQKLCEAIRTPKIASYRQSPILSICQGKKASTMQSMQMAPLYVNLSSFYFVYLDFKEINILKLSRDSKSPTFNLFVTQEGTYVESSSTIRLETPQLLINCTLSIAPTSLLKWLS